MGEKQCPYVQTNYVFIFLPKEYAFITYTISPYLEFECGYLSCACDQARMAPWRDSRYGLRSCINSMAHLFLLSILDCPWWQGHRPQSGQWSRLRGSLCIPWQAHDYDPRHSPKFGVSRVASQVRLSIDHLQEKFEVMRERKGIYSCSFTSRLHVQSGDSSWVYLDPSLIIKASLILCHVIIWQSNFTLIELLLLFGLTL